MVMDSMRNNKLRLNLRGAVSLVRVLGCDCTLMLDESELPSKVSVHTKSRLVPGYCSACCGEECLLPSLAGSTTTSLPR